MVEKPKPPKGKTDHKLAGSKLVLVVVAHERKREICFGGLFLIESGKALGAFRNLQPFELLGREENFQPDFGVTPSLRVPKCPQARTAATYSRAPR